MSEYSKVENRAKQRRTVKFDKKLRDLITLPDAKDYNTFRDTVEYPQLAANSTMWPEKLYGNDDADIIRAKVLTNNNEFIKSVYITKDDIVFVPQSGQLNARHGHLQIDGGKILRDCGFRRGRFKIDFDFFRLKSGGPFPFLINGDEKIYRGEFRSEDGIITATAGQMQDGLADESSGTQVGEKLYIRQNKNIIQTISGDRTEVVITPQFTDDVDSIEALRKAAYNCINVFPMEGQQAQIFPITSGVTLTGDVEMSNKFINGTIRVKDAFVIGEREVPEEREEVQVDPDVEAVDQPVNLLDGKYLDNTSGWAVNSPVPNDSIIPGIQNDPDDIAATTLDSVVEPNPVGQYAVLHKINHRLVQGGGVSPSIARRNMSFSTVPNHTLGPDLVDGETYTFTVFAKLGNLANSVPGGDSEKQEAQARLEASSGPLIGQTRVSQFFTINQKTWTRLSHTFTLTNSEGLESIKFRCVFNGFVTPAFPNPVDTLEQTFVEGTEVLWAGAMVERSGEVNDFTRNSSPINISVERTVSNILKFNDPDDNIINAEFSDAEPVRFLPEMAGGLFKIKNGMAVKDTTETTVTADKVTEKIYSMEGTMPVEGANGIPGNFKPGWNPKLHGQAIEVVDEDNSSKWTSGYIDEDPDLNRSHAGTGEVGYHAHWVKDKGIYGGPCMYFPDLNFQDYILNDMRQVAFDAWTDPEIGYYFSRGLPDPRLEQLETEAWGHRKMQITTTKDTAGNYALGTLASYGVMAGDTLKVSWVQKAGPINFDQGGRKGCVIGLNHQKQIEFNPPAAWDASNLNDSDFLFFDVTNIERGDQIFGIDKSTFEFSPLREENISPKDPPDGYQDPTNAVDPSTFEPKPIETPPTPTVVNQTTFSDRDYWKMVSRRSTAGEVLSGASQYQWGDWVVNRGANSPVPEDWDYFDNLGQWQGPNSTEDLTNVNGVSVPGVYTENGEDFESDTLGWTWNNNQWRSNFIKDNSNFHMHRQEITITETMPPEILSQIEQLGDLADFLGRKIIVKKNIYAPSFNSIEVAEGFEGDLTFYNKTLDANWIWDGGKWIWNGGDDVEFDAEANAAFITEWTYDVIEQGDKLARSELVLSDEYMEWEEKTFEIPLPEDEPLWRLDEDFVIVVEGHYGDFGPLYIDQLKVEVILSSSERYEVYPDAVLADLEFEIEEVINETTIRVDKNYEDAVAFQNGILSNFVVNKYTDFGAGFSIDYVTRPASVEDIMGNYEAKILGIDGNELLVDKSFIQAAEEFGVTVTGDPTIPRFFDTWFIRYRYNDPDNLYTYLVFGDVEKSLIINFKPVQTAEYPGGVAFKLLNPLPDGIEKLDLCYIAEEVTPSLVETLELIPFIDEKVPDTVLRVPDFSNFESPIRDRETTYKSHTDIVGVDQDVRKKLEDKYISGSLDNINVNIDYSQYKNFIHFGSAEERIKAFHRKFTRYENFANTSRSLGGTIDIQIDITPENLGTNDFLKQQTGLASTSYTNQSSSFVSSSSEEIEKFNVAAREVVNGFDDFENYMFVRSSSYSSSSLGEFYDNAPPKASGDGTLTNPYVIYPVTSSQYISWYNDTLASASLYDRKNTNMLTNLIPGHVIYDERNSEFITFMNMIGHHYDIIWTYIKGLSDVHDRSEDITEGISAALVKPVAESLGFKMIEGKDLVRLPKYELGLEETTPGSGVHNLRFTKKSQKEVTQEIWNRILANMPYMLKTKGTKQSLKSLIAAYGIPTSILRIQEYGGPSIAVAEKDFAIKTRQTKAVDIRSGERIGVPWYETTPAERTPDTVEFRFRAIHTGHASGSIIADKTNTVYTGTIYSSIFIKNDPNDLTRGQLTFAMSGSGTTQGTVSMSLSKRNLYNGEYWSVMLRRRKPNTLNSSFTAQTVANDNAATQSFDLFLGYYDSGIDKVTIFESASMDVLGDLTKGYTGVDTQHTFRKWWFGAAGSNFQYGSAFSGSLMEVRYWSTPLTASAFFNHVQAPKAVNGNHFSSSYYDLSLRLSMDDNINLSSGGSPYGLKDYTFTDSQTFATASNFSDRVAFSNVEDRQKSFVPKIGIANKANKIRIEDDVKLTSLSGLKIDQRSVKGAYDTAGLDSGKLGIYLAPSDVINEDIILSLADLNFDDYLGDYRDTVKETYEFGGLANAREEYWRKWTTRFNFWDYIKLIKYYDLSLFHHLKKLSPGRANKTVGLLIENTLLERPKIVIAKKPVLSRLLKTGIGDASRDVSKTTRTLLRENPRGVLFPISGSSLNDMTKEGKIPPAVVPTGSAALEFRTGSASAKKEVLPTSNLIEKFGSLGSAIKDTSKGDRIDYKTDDDVRAIREFNISKGNDQLIPFEFRDYTSVIVNDNFFEAVLPAATGSVLSEFNDNRIYHYNKDALYNPTGSSQVITSESLERSDITSIYDTHAGLKKSAYDGVLNSEDPDGLPAVSIVLVNPNDVVTGGDGDTYIDVE